MTRRMTAAEAVVESLIRHGIDTLYALPGVHNDPLFDAAQRAEGRFRVLHPRHEQASAYMALGAALLDEARGGRFRIAPLDSGYTTKQLYLPDS
ncbi:MAG: thiamine pyrophosphate-binding protein, partial [Acetobacteraceae bacterium]